MEIAKFKLKEKHFYAEGDTQYGHWKLIGLEAKEDGEIYTTMNSLDYTEEEYYEVPYEVVEKNGRKSKRLLDGKKKSGGGGGSSSELKAQMDLLTDRVKKLEEFMQK